MKPRLPRKKKKAMKKKGTYRMWYSTARLSHAFKQIGCTAKEAADALRQTANLLDWSKKKHQTI